MGEALSWGILGTGNIASQFAAGVRVSRRGRLAAVGSRRLETARAFAQTHNIPTAHASYRELIADRDVDAVYVSLPNSMHHEWTLAALQAGKHVLCEKPFAVNVAQAQQMFDAAEKARRTLVEAFMYRSHPIVDAVRGEIDSGAIGTLRLIRTSFCYRTRRIEGNIRFDPSLAGGALMDIGCYCVDFSRLFARQEPRNVHAVAHMHERGIDDIVTGTMIFPSGLIASFSCGMSLQADNTATLCGDDGYIEIPVPWKPPAVGAAYTIAHGHPPRQDKPPARQPPPRQTYCIDAGMDLYGLEADDFVAVVRDGAQPRVTRDDTLGNMRVLDEIRRQIGLPF